MINFLTRIVIIIFSGFLCFYVGGVYRLSLEKSRIQIEAAVKAAKYQNLRDRINESSDAALSVAHFCRFVLGVQNDARKTCMRRLGKIKPENGNGGPHISE